MRKCKAEYYDESIRLLLEEENKLRDQRINWSLIVHGILLTAILQVNSNYHIKISSTPIVEIESYCITGYIPFSLIICFVGLMVAISTDG